MPRGYNWSLPPFEKTINYLLMDLEQAREDGNLALVARLRRQIESLSINYQLEQALN